MAKRLIDANALEADLKRQYNAVFGDARKTVKPEDFFIDRDAAYRANVTKAEQDGFFKYLKTRPTVDAVEVVRCYQCKHFGRNAENDTYCSARNGLSDPEPDDFCSYGERKGGQAPQREDV